MGHRELVVGSPKLVYLGDSCVKPLPDFLYAEPLRIQVLFIDYVLNQVRDFAG